MRLEWEEFAGKIHFPVLIKGDSDVVPTRRWNHHFLRKWVWKTVVFEVEPGWATNGYRIGFWPTGRIDAKISTQVLHDHRLALKIGRESCRFFLTLPDGQPLPAPALREFGTIGREIPIY